MTDERTDRWTDRREGGISGLDISASSSKSQEIHAVPSYKEHLYKERLVDSLEYKEQRLVSFQIVKEHVFQVA